MVVTQPTSQLSRRGFLRATATGSLAAGIAAQPGTATSTSTGSETVVVGPDGDFVFSPGTDQPLYVSPGTTVEFVWDSGGHNIHVDQQPDGANWQGHEAIEDAGFSITHTFEVKGRYHFWCVPHKSLGMIGDIVVTESGTPPSGQTPSNTPATKKSPSSNQTSTGSPTNATGSSADQGKTVDVELVDFAFNPGTDEPLEIPPGSTVNFIWKTGGHNIYVDQQPAGANWQGHETIEDAGFTYSHTFDVEGKYHYWCVPHKSLGMVADIVVTENVSTRAASGGGGKVDPEEMGVPLRSHWIGLTTLLAVTISLVFTFFFLKYGTSPHTGYPKRKQ